jgi:hypothetical protein
MRFRFLQFTPISPFLACFSQGFTRQFTAISRRGAQVPPIKGENAMTDITTHSTDIQLSTPRFHFLGLLLRFFTEGIRALNRDLDAASLVHPSGRPEPDTSREQSWEGPL